MPDRVIIADTNGNMLPDWVVLVAVQDVARQQLIEIQPDKGESSAIAIALEIPLTRL